MRTRLRSYLGQMHEVLLEGVSKRSAEHLYGRNSQNSIVIVPRVNDGVELEPGMLIRAEIHSTTIGSLKGRCSIPSIDGIACEGMNVQPIKQRFGIIGTSPGSTGPLRSPRRWLPRTSAY